MKTAARSSSCLTAVTNPSPDRWGPRLQSSPWSPRGEALWYRALTGPYMISGEKDRQRCLRNTCRSVHRLPSPQTQEEILTGIRVLGLWQLRGRSWVWDLTTSSPLALSWWGRERAWWHIWLCSHVLTKIYFWNIHVMFILQTQK